MKKSIVLVLSDEELLDLERIIADADQGEALRFLQEHLKGAVRRAVESTGHCDPWREVLGRGTLTGPET